MAEFHTLLAYENPALEEADPEKESCVDAVKSAACQVWGGRGVNTSGMGGRDVSTAKSGACQVWKRCEHTKCGRVQSAVFAYQTFPPFSPSLALATFAALTPPHPALC